MKKVKSVKKVGRPALSVAERNSRHLRFRARLDMYKRLGVAAKESGRPISREIERRLELSFEVDKREQELDKRQSELYSTALDAAMRAVSGLQQSVMKIIDERLPKVNSTNGGVPLTWFATPGQSLKDAGYRFYELT